MGCWLVPPKTIILGLRTNCVLIFVAHASSKERNFVQKNIENYNKRNACGKLKFTLSLGRDRRGARKILRCQRAKRVPEHSNDDNPSLGVSTLFLFVSNNKCTLELGRITSAQRGFRRATEEEEGGGETF